MTGERAGRGDERRVSPNVGGLSDPRPFADGGPSEPRLFDAFPDPLVRYEREADSAVVREVNPAFERTFGAEEAALVGEPLADHLPVGGADAESDPDGGGAGFGTRTCEGGTGSENSERSAEAILPRLDEAESVIVATVPSPDGGRRYFRLRAVPLPDADARNCLVFTEVTGLKRRLREVETRAERLERFIDVAAHDLRNPLEVAKIRLEAARDTAEDTHFEKADAALDRMQHIIRDVLSVGGAELDASREVAVDEVAEAAWSTVDTDGATLDIGTDLPTVAADGDLLQQLFENLFRNAVEHGSTSHRPEDDDAVAHGSTSPRSQAREDAAERRGRNLTVTVGGLPDGFYVADDGRGVPPEERGRVFEPGFSTADDNTGLGLAIVTRIAEGHGWHVALTEAEAGGARFEFTGIGSDDRNT